VIVGASWEVLCDVKGKAACHLVFWGRTTRLAFVGLHSGPEELPRITLNRAISFDRLRDSRRGPDLL
jgi:hypothetical protein